MPDPKLNARCISLPAVTSVVLANNPAIQQSLRKWGAAKARVTQEAAWDDLGVSGNSRAARFVDVAPNAFTDQMVSVEQVIPITGKIFCVHAIAAADAVAAFEQARREQLDVLGESAGGLFSIGQRLCPTRTESKESRFVAPDR